MSHGIPGRTSSHGGMEPSVRTNPDPEAQAQNHVEAVPAERFPESITRGR